MSSDRRWRDTSRGGLLRESDPRRTKLMAEIQDDVSADSITTAETGPKEVFESKGAGVRGSAGNGWSVVQR